jgi:hypothetical protein
MSGGAARAAGVRAVLLLAGVLIAWGPGLPARQDSPAAPVPNGDSSVLAPNEQSPGTLMAELKTAGIRLPVATLLGAALAFRPRRRGTPMRQPAVIQTQIVLAIVGAVIMLVVGSNLARAFGIVGVASLIRYRSKISDPKDAVVMLSALSVGLASGAGLLALASFATMFLVGALWLLEGFDPQTRRFELAVKLGPKTSEMRPRIETLLRRYHAEFELRSSSEEEVSYVVTVPLRLHTDRVSSALTKLAPEGKGSIEWKEPPKDKT